MMMMMMMMITIIIVIFMIIINISTNYHYDLACYPPPPPPNRNRKTISLLMFRDLTCHCSWVVSAVPPLESNYWAPMMAHHFTKGYRTRSSPRFGCPKCCFILMSKPFRASQVVHDFFPSTVSSTETHEDVFLYVNNNDNNVYKIQCRNRIHINR